MCTGLIEGGFYIKKKASEDVTTTNPILNHEFVLPPTRDPVYDHPPT